MFMNYATSGSITVFKGAAKPTLLAGRVNFEVMGANEWRHAASIDAMAGGMLNSYLNAAAGDQQRLTLKKPQRLAFVRQWVNLADRKDASWMPSTDLISKSLAMHNDRMFVSEPILKTTEFNGSFSLRLDFTVNKMDVDLNVILYERHADGGCCPGCSLPPMKFARVMRATAYIGIF